MFSDISVHLIYLDDGGKDAIKVFGGVVVDHSQFSHLEHQSAMIVYDLLGDERREHFTEFHASDLYYGKHAFEGIPEPLRHDAFRSLIRLRKWVRVAYVYSAVDTKALSRSPFGSASWIDIAFFMCACSIDEYIRRQYVAAWEQAAARAKDGSNLDRPDALLSLMIVDEPGNQKDKPLIKNTFRKMRQPVARAMQRTHPTELSFTWSNRLTSPVDDIFFGSSADSLGLQLADACNWVMWKHLCGEDVGGLYEELIDGGAVISAKPEPEWTQYQHLLRSHD